ncbi:MAG TPA: helix-turn-helix domain-containing protein [Polyangia bacterium]|nr:helix-turn-helix domain-containing protein [Polyangia bacterium]
METESIVDDESTTVVFLRPGAEAHRPATRAGGRSGLWNPADVAAFLQVSRSWVYQKAEAGLLPVIRLPGSSLLRFEPEAIRAFARGEWMPAKLPAVHAVKKRK